MSTPVYLFDLDGTLSAHHHREHLIAEGRWEEYFIAGGEDAPRTGVIATLKHLHSAQPRPIIYIFTGCGEVARPEREAWLIRHGITLGENGMVKAMFMRPKDYRDTDVKLKQKMLASLPDEERNAIVAVFEDRNSVVAMWRSLGINCYQVAEGDF